MGWDVATNEVQDNRKQRGEEKKEEEKEFELLHKKESSNEGRQNAISTPEFARSNEGRKEERELRSLRGAVGVRKAKAILPKINNKISGTLSFRTHVDIRGEGGAPLRVKLGGGLTTGKRTDQVCTRQNSRQKNPMTQGEARALCGGGHAGKTTWGG